MYRRLLTIAACISIGAVSAQEATPPTVEPAILQSVEEKYSSELSKGEADLAKIKKAAAAARLKAYKEKLTEVTKSGDFDKALPLKARVDLLEKDSELEPSKPSKRPRPKDVVKFGGHTYALIKEPATWHVAKQRCEEMGGHLVCVNSEKEESFVATLCGKNLCWVGATDEAEEGRWVNVDGSSPVFTIAVFDNASDTEYWLSFDGVNTHKFNDVYTGGRLPYICEWDR